MKRTFTIRALLTALVAGVAAVSCDAAKTPAASSSTALFDYFNYSGEDDFYTDNPLTDESAFYNPILPGWYSDPAICTNGEGDYFLATSTFTYFPGVPLFHSRDLVNWKQVGHILDRPSQLVNMVGQHVSGGIFAPAIAYNPHNRTYYMITTNVGAGNFFVKTQDPFGAWSDPIALPTVRGIDPSFFFDDNGKAYIVNNDDAPGDKPEYPGHRTIRIREFDVENDCTTGPEVILVNKGVNPQEKPIWIEGPHMYKINGKYFLMSAEGGTSNWHSEVIFRGDAPMGKFTPWEHNPMLTQRHLDPKRPNPITCAGHADLIQTAEGDWWAVFLACRPINGNFENLGRETFLMPLRWSEDGFPYLTQGEEIIPAIVKRDGVQRAADVTFGNFERNDDFDAPELGMEWLTLRTRAEQQWSLTAEPGYLALTCSPVKATGRDVPAFVGRRMQHHKFTCTTRMVFDPSDAATRAGVLLFKDEQHQYFLAAGCTAGTKSISLYKIGAEGDELLATQPLDDDTQVLDLQVESKGLTYDFWYGTRPGKLQLLCKDVDAKYLSTEVAGGFTGTLIGMYADRTDE